MKPDQRIFAGVVFALLFIFPHVVLAQCESQAELFLNHPNQKTYVELLDSSAGHLRSDCKDFLLQPTVNDRHLQYVEVNDRLLQSVEIGNKWSIGVLTDVIDILDGGDLEDAHRALGVSLENNPKALLRLHAKSKIDSYTLTRSAYMLPLSLVDNESGELSRLRKRLDILSKVDSPDLVASRDIAISALKDALKDKSPLPSP